MHRLYGISAFTLRSIYINRIDIDIIIIIPRTLVLFLKIYLENSRSTIIKIKGLT